ncbi:gamma-type small acid-soluble spore protein [Bacillus sp. 2205SS5-2]|uniref:gamma-type small acid-soluble spore protein n=1 Tax=Bacillus sp. 2205SS5-2 TaxID=3109031 RepID=UPI003FA59552
MAKNNKQQTAAGTNVQQVKQQNAQAGQQAQQYGTEFASETDLQQVKQQNAQSQAKKAQAQAPSQQNQPNQ